MSVTGILVLQQV